MSKASEIMARFDKTSWKCLTNAVKAIEGDDYRPYPASNKEVFEDIRGALREAFAELEALAMPEGYEWPRYEDGELVQFGDIIGMQNGWWMEHPADEMVFHADGSVEVFGDGNSVVFERGEKARRIVLAADGEPLEPGQTVWSVTSGKPATVTRLTPDSFIDENGVDRVPDCFTHRRPAFDADGNRIEEGMDVWWICDSDERGIHAEKLHVDGIDDDGEAECSPYCGGTSVVLEPSELYVNKPVLDADGVPIHEGDTVYLWDKYRDYAGSITSMCSMIGIHGGTCLHVVKVDDRRLKFDECLASCPPDWVTHEPPDSWGRIEEESRCIDEFLDERFGLGAPSALELVRRAKALSERDAS